MEVNSTIRPAGYSGTPLAKKLGIKPGFHINLVNAPDYYFNLFEDLPLDLVFGNRESIKEDLIHFFTKQENEFITTLPMLKKQIKPNGIIWISWS